ncbi:MAG TPA: cellulose synthase operon protein YhjQ/BcsQ [Stellaceae bacterium]|nr:cellulose synthase operon protein YhjQ/BcsQ [Stellaceae bacterium]
MPLIVVTSFKGGAGKTTLAANLAVGLRSVGWDVMAVDANPQDALKLHFGLAAGDGRGTAESGVDVVPFTGDADGSDELIGIVIAEAVRRMVIVDAPSLPAASARALTRAADVVVVATPTDAGSFAALSLADAETALAEDGVLARTVVVANQFDKEARLQRSVLALLNETFGDKLAATVERDQIVDEALASRRTVLLHDQTSKAARSLVALAIHVDRLCSPNGELN